MAKRSITRLASAAVVTGIASLALAAPASAMIAIDPDGGAGSLSTPAPPAASGTDWELSQVATGALGGLALAGASIAAVAGLRRQRQNLAHPA